VPRIALLFANTPTAEIMGPQPTSPYLIAFLKGMRDLGWLDGQNIIIERRSADGKPDRFPALVNEVVGLNVALMMITARLLRYSRHSKRVPRCRSYWQGPPIQNISSGSASSSPSHAQAAA